MTYHRNAFRALTDQILYTNIGRVRLHSYAFPAIDKNAVFNHNIRTIECVPTICFIMLVIISKGLGKTD
jgi:hypothetical protein